MTNYAVFNSVDTNIQKKKKNERKSEDDMEKSFNAINTDFFFFNLTR